MARIEIPTNTKLLQYVCDKVCPALSAALVYSIMHNMSYDKLIIKAELQELPKGVNLCYSRVAFYRYRKQVLDTYKFMGGVCDMSAHIIKEKLSGLTTVCGTTVNACSALTHATSGGNADNVISACQRFISCMKQTEQYVDMVYADTSRELEILLADFNRNLKTFNQTNKGVIKEVYPIIGLAMKLKVLQGLNGVKFMGKEISLHIDTKSTESKLKSKAGVVSDYKGKVSTMQMMSQQANKKIIIKESNFK